MPRGSRKWGVMIRQLSVFKHLSRSALAGAGLLLVAPAVAPGQDASAPAQEDAAPAVDSVAPAPESAPPVESAPPAEEAPRRRNPVSQGRGGVGEDVSSAQWHEEYRALNQLIQRFDEEVDEFERDVQDAIDQKYNEELRRYQQQFDAQLLKLQDEVTVYRKEAIARYEQFLQRYPNSEHSAIAMVRLAELYYEEAQIDFLFAHREYDRQWEEYGDGKRSTPPPEEEPLQDLTRS